MNHEETELFNKMYAALKEKNHKIRELENGQNQDIAIIGTGVRAPGGVQNMDDLWEVLKSGRDATTDVPEGRWGDSSFLDPDKEAPGKTYTTKGGYLAGSVYGFDAGFFNITPKELKGLDPQQRLLLEVSWEALENSNIEFDTLNGSNTGVFVGVSSDDYSSAHRNSGTLSEIDAYSLTGTTASTASGRISYFYGFEGPAISIDTACSSSLVALHLACNSLQRYETDMMLVGCVNLILSPSAHVSFSKLTAIAPDGKCKTFDESADGYSRGEGCIFVVLKRLSDALEAGNPILGVIKGSAVNQDGKSNGFTAPNGSAQEKVIRRALRNARLDITDIDYLEAHGTGTKLGDPIEVGAIGNLYKDKSVERKLLIGSIKTNIGHLEPASGLAGILKLLLSFKHKKLPASLHFKTPNSFIDWNNLPIQVVDKLTAWEKQDAQRRASVSAFGFSGTNAHVVLEEYIKEETFNEDSTEIKSDNDQIGILTLSAASPEALDSLRERYIKYLMHIDDAEVSQVCGVSNRHRKHFEHRLAAVGGTCEELLKQLNVIDSNQLSAEVVLVFTELEAAPEYRDRHKYLFLNNNVFKIAFEKCDGLAKKYLNYSIVDHYLNEENSQFSGDVLPLSVALLSFSLQYASWELLKSFGVRPSSIFASGIGVYNAICSAGISDLENVLKVLVMSIQKTEYSERDILKHLNQISTRNVRTKVWSIDTLNEVLSLNDALCRVNDQSNSNEAKVEFQQYVNTLIPFDVLLLGEKTKKLDSCFNNATSDRSVYRFLEEMQSSGSIDQWKSMLIMLSKLYMKGASINWSNVGNRKKWDASLTIPTYPFQRTIYQKNISFNLEMDRPKENSILPMTAAIVPQPEKVGAYAAEHFSSEDCISMDDRPVLERIQSASGEEAKKILYAELVRLTIDAIGLEADEQFDDKRSLTDYGIDSLIFAELLWSIEDALGIGLGDLASLEERSIKGLCDYIFECCLNTV